MENETMLPSVNPALPEIEPEKPKKYSTNILSIILLILLCIFLLPGGFFAGLKYASPKTPSQPMITGYPSPTLTTTPENMPDEIVTRPTAFVKPMVTPPSIYGFTKLIDLSGIGVRASFPQSATVTAYDTKTSYGVDADNFSVSFIIYNYDGGSRRAWYEANIGKSNYEAYSANNHQGYISYSKDSSGNYYGLGYFTAVKPTKMLVVRTGFTDINKLKSLISTMTIIEPNIVGANRPDQAKLETERVSDQIFTVWENSDLGLRITAPEWIGSRYTTARNSDGTWKYSDWMRVKPEAKENSYENNGENYKSVFITGKLFGNTTLTILDPRYTGMSFTDVINSKLPGAGFCATEWKSSKADCGDIHSEFCYTKDEVIAKLVLRKTASIGPYTGQLRGINASFSQLRDCRGEDVWLIQTKNKQYVLSTIYPDDEVIKLEGL